MDPLLTTTDTPPTAARPAQQEADVWWGGAASMAMLPSLLVCVLLSAIIIAIAFWLGAEHIVPATIARWLIWGLLPGVWLVQVLRWAYRLAAYSYRLTTQRVWCDWGPLFVPPPPLDLAELKAVRIEQTGWQRRLHVGQVVLEAANRPQPLVLAGVHRPERIAALIQLTLEQHTQREASVEP
jgi:hypothetical protein